MRAAAQLHSQDKVAIAHHEAGHAVLAHRLGFTVFEIVILPGDGRSGYIDFDRKHDFDVCNLPVADLLDLIQSRESVRRECEEHLRIALAGQAVEVDILKANYRAKESWSGDDALFDRFAVALDLSGPEKDSIRSEVNEEVKRLETPIRAVARAVQRSGKIRGEEFLELMAQS
jgi:hypothetical protein